MSRAEGSIGVHDDVDFNKQTGSGGDTEPVNEKVVAVIFPEDADLGDLVAQREAVDKEGELGAEGDDNGDDGGQMEIANGRHEEAEADVAGCFDAGFAGGELAGVDAVDGLVTEEQGEVGHGVEDGVGHCCEEGERARRDGTVELEDGEDDVRGEAAVDGDFVFELVVDADFAGVADVLFDGFQHALDVLILRVVEAL
ncbi:hypothetical protein APSETT444_009604 [Aspergillus pseudonomiae]